MNAVVRPIHLPSATALNELRERANTALLAWARGWLGDAGQMLHRLQVKASETNRSGRYELLQGASGSLWVSCDQEGLLALKHQVVGESPDDDWTTEVVRRAREARDRALLVALLGAHPSEQASEPVSVLPSELFAFGSGAVEFSCDTLGLHAIADRGVWRNVPPSSRAAANRPSSVTVLDHAVQTAQASVEVILGSVQLELPKVLDLRRGDVLRLPRRLDQPVELWIEGKPLMQAALGETLGRKAVCIEVP